MASKGNISTQIQEQNSIPTRTERRTQKLERTREEATYKRRKEKLSEIVETASNIRDPKKYEKFYQKQPSWAKESLITPQEFKQRRNEQINKEKSKIEKRIDFLERKQYLINKKPGIKTDIDLAEFSAYQREINYLKNEALPKVEQGYSANPFLSATKEGTEQGLKKISLAEKVIQKSELEQAEEERVATYSKIGGAFLGKDTEGNRPIITFSEDAYKLATKPTVMLAYKDIRLTEAAIGSLGIDERELKELVFEGTLTQKEADLLVEQKKREIKKAQYESQPSMVELEYPTSNFLYREFLGISQPIPFYSYPQGREEGTAVRSASKKLEEIQSRKILEESGFINQDKPISSLIKGTTAVSTAVFFRQFRDVFEGVNILSEIGIKRLEGKDLGLGGTGKPYGLYALRDISSAGEKEMKKVIDVFGLTEIADAPITSDLTQAWDIAELTTGVFFGAKKLASAAKRVPRTIGSSVDEALVPLVKQDITENIIKRPKSFDESLVRGLAGRTDDLTPLIKQDLKTTYKVVTVSPQVEKKIVKYARIPFISKKYELDRISSINIIGVGGKAYAEIDIAEEVLKASKIGLKPKRVIEYSKQYKLLDVTRSSTFRGASVGKELIISNTNLLDYLKAERKIGLFDIGAEKSSGEIIGRMTKFQKEAAIGRTIDIFDISKKELDNLDSVFKNTEKIKLSKTPETFETMPRLTKVDFNIPEKLSIDSDLFKVNKRLIEMQGETIIDVAKLEGMMPKTTTRIQFKATKTETIIDEINQQIKKIDSPKIDKIEKTLKEIDTGKATKQAQQQSQQFNIPASATVDTEAQQVAAAVEKTLQQPKTKQITKSIQTPAFESAEIGRITTKQFQAISQPQQLRDIERIQSVQRPTQEIRQLQRIEQEIRQLQRIGQQQNQLQRLATIETSVPTPPQVPTIPINPPTSTNPPSVPIFNFDLDPMKEIEKEIKKTQLKAEIPYSPSFAAIALGVKPLELTEKEFRKYAKMQDPFSLRRPVIIKKRSKKR